MTCCGPQLCLWDVLYSSDTSKQDPFASFVQFLWTALLEGHRHFQLWVVVGLQPIRGSFHLNQDQLHNCFWKAHSVTSITPSRAGFETVWQRGWSGGSFAQQTTSDLVKLLTWGPRNSILPRIFWGSHGQCCRSKWPWVRPATDLEHLCSQSLPTHSWAD